MWFLFPTLHLIFIRTFKTNIMEDLLNCHGRRFRAQLVKPHLSRIVEGKITIEGNEIFLCQDYVGGVSCEDKQGYAHSYMITEKDMGVFQNFCLVFRNPSEYKDWQVGDKVKLGTHEGHVIFRSGELVVLDTEEGYHPVSFTCDKMFNVGWRLAEEEDLVELTLEDVAKLKGVSVDRIRIMEK